MTLLGVETPIGFAPTALKHALRALSAMSLAIGADRPPAEPTDVCSPVADAMEFALRLLASDATQRSVGVVQSCDRDAVVRCDRRALRQIIRCLGSAAIQLTEPVGEVTINAQVSRGVVLLRVGSFASTAVTALRELAAVQMAAALVADADGTLLCESGPGGVRISVRLPRAPAAEDRDRSIRQVVGAAS